MYKTKNIYIAAFLLARGGAGFKGVEWENEKTGQFCFINTEVAQTLEAEYIDGGPASGKALFAEYNHLKDLLFKERT